LQYASNCLTPTESQYCTTRRELLAVVKYFKLFRHYLLGRHFTLRTDHQSLTWLLNWKNPSSSQYYSWIEQIMEYDFTIQHRPGKNHTNADFLSRIKACEQCELKHLEPKKRRNTKVFNLIQQSSEISALKQYLQNDSAENEAMLKQTQFWKYRDNLKLIGDVLFYEKNGKFFQVLSCESGKEKSKKYHSLLAHPGFGKLYNSMKQIYFWPSMKQSILNVVQQCKWCSQRKSKGQTRELKKGLYSEYPFQKIFLDLTGPLPTTKTGFRYILAVIDGYSKWTSLIPLKSCNARDVVNGFLQNWISIYGPPEKIHSDNVLRKEMDGICDLFAIKHTTSSPYYPQGNAMVERLFRTTKDLIFCTTQENRCEWDEILWKVNLSLRSCYNETIKMSPYEIVFQKTRFNFSLSDQKKIITSTELES